MKLTALSILWFTSASVVCGQPIVGHNNEPVLDVDARSAATGPNTLKEVSSVVNDLGKVPSTDAGTIKEHATKDDYRNFMKLRRKMENTLHNLIGSQSSTSQRRSVELETDARTSEKSSSHSKKASSSGDSHDSSLSGALTGGLTLLKQFSTVENEIKKVPETEKLTAATLEVLMEELVRLQTVMNNSKEKSDPSASSDSETGSSTAQLDGQWKGVLQKLQDLTQTAKKNSQVLEKEFKKIEAVWLVMVGQLQHHFGGENLQADSS